MNREIINTQFVLDVCEFAKSISNSNKVGMVTGCHESGKSTALTCAVSDAAKKGIKAVKLNMQCSSGPVPIMQSVLRQIDRGLAGALPNERLELHDMILAAISRNRIGLLVIDYYGIVPDDNLQEFMAIADSFKNQVDTVENDPHSIGILVSGICNQSSYQTSLFGTDGIDSLLFGRLRVPHYDKTLELAELMEGFDGRAKEFYERIVSEDVPSVELAKKIVERTGGIVGRVEHVMKALSSVSKKSCFANAEIKNALEKAYKFHS